MCLLLAYKWKKVLPQLFWKYLGDYKLYISPGEKSSKHLFRISALAALKNRFR